MRISTTRALGVVATAAALTLGTAAPVSAAPSSALFVGGSGIAADDGAGGIVIDGPGSVGDKHLREVLDAHVRSTVSVDDGSLPAIGECEPATAGVVVDGERDGDLTLASDGTVCHHQHPTFPTFVWMAFTGVHEVTDAKRPQLRGGTGSLTVSFLPGRFSTVHADSFVPVP
jgi:hypothetical protein